MKPYAAVAMLALAWVGAAHAQQTFEPRVPRGLPEMQIEPLREPRRDAPPAAAAPLPPRLIQNQRRGSRDADARHCLAAQNNKAVHRCAERYRHRKGGARVRKTSAKPAAAPAPVAIIRSEDSLKPGAPRASDAAKAADLVKPMDVTKPGGTPRPIESAAPAAPLRSGDVLKGK